VLRVNRSEHGFVRKRSCGECRRYVRQRTGDAVGLKLQALVRVDVLARSGSRRTPTVDLDGGAAD
jgi:hypothetical protein